MKSRHPSVNKSIVKLDSKSGSHVKGTLYLEDHHGGIVFTGKISGLKPGKHGFHIHQNGDCSSKDAKSAGDHFMLMGQSHGDKEAAGSHLGDLGNIEAQKDGTAEINIFVKGLSLQAGDRSIVGKSIVVHADTDDLKTQPTGNSGKRIACGVITLASCDTCADCHKHCEKSDCPKSKDCPGHCKGKDCKCKADCGCKNCGCEKCAGKKATKS